MTREKPATRGGNTAVILLAAVVVGGRRISSYSSTGHLLSALRNQKNPAAGVLKLEDGAFYTNFSITAPGFLVFPVNITLPFLLQRYPISW